MICKQCGREIPDHAIYCRYCGTRLSEKEARQASDLIPERPKRRVLPVILTILALALIAGLFFWLRGRSRNIEPEPAPADPTVVEPAQTDLPEKPEKEDIKYGLRIDGDDNIIAGKDVILKAVLEPESEIKRTVWTSSDPAVATVSDGIVTGVGEGETIIRCLMALKSGPVLEAELPFRVLPKPYALQLEPEVLELSAGTADSFSIDIKAQDGSEVTNAEITWDSSDPMVAAVTDGRVQAVGEGTAQITANITLPDGSSETLTGNVTVTPAEANPTPSASQISVPTPAPAPAPAPEPAPAPAPAPEPEPSGSTTTVSIYDPVGVAPVKTEDYLISNSDKEYLNLQDLLKMTDDELVMARNEIFARHGRQFVLDYIRDYFNSKSWYQGTIAPEAFDPKVFNEFERSNVERMVYAEEHN